MLPLTVPEMVYVSAVLDLAEKPTSFTDADWTIAARLTGLNTYPVRLGAMVYFPLLMPEKLKLPLELVIVVLAVAPMSLTVVAAAPDTAPEMVYAALDPEGLLACAELPPGAGLPTSLQAANETKLRKTSAVNRRVECTMEYLNLATLSQGACFMGNVQPVQLSPDRDLLYSLSVTGVTRARVDAMGRCARIM